MENSTLLPHHSSLSHRNPFEDPSLLFNDPLSFLFSVLDLDQGVLRAWWVDPLVSSLGFALVINFYWYQERKHNLNVDKFSFNPGDLVAALLGYWGGVILWKCVVPAPIGEVSDGIPHDFASFCYLCFEIVSGIILYDFLFFWVHWAMHDISFLKKIHKTHHSKLRVEAKDVLRHSFIDGSLQVIVNIIVQRHTPWGMVKSRLARAIHNFIVIWMLTESHTSAPSYDIFRWWCVGVREHRLHHLGKEGIRREKGEKKEFYGRYHRHQQFFGYLDDLRVYLKGG